jgi:hypothetical protein
VKNGGKKREERREEEKEKMGIKTQKTKKRTGDGPWRRRGRGGLFLPFVCLFVCLFVDMLFLLLLDRGQLKKQVIGKRYPDNEREGMRERDRKAGKELREGREGNDDTIKCHRPALNHGRHIDNK